jgi:hypothetical protein
MLDARSVVPGSFYQIDNGAPYKGGPTDEGLKAPLIITQVPVVQQDIVMTKSRNFFASVFGLSTSNSFELKVDSSDLTCIGIDPVDGGPLDHLVYEDTKIKDRLRTSLRQNGTGIIVEAVCFTTHFNMTAKSSREFMASANKGAIPPCTQTDTEKKSTEALKSTSTVSDLLSKLKSPLFNIPVAFSSCTSDSNTVTLKTEVPVAIGMKVWNVYKCGANERFACVNPSADDPNQLEFRQASYPYFY